MSYGPLQNISPAQGEPYRQFVVRAHQALMQTIPDPDERNEAVWKSWYSVHGDPLGDRARKKFASDGKYRHYPAECYFIEHETTGRDGSIQRYQQKEIADLVDEHQQREDTGCYTAITDGHTIDGAPNKMQPRVIGYAGNYRLGMVGYTNPKYAVFADEWREENELPTFQAKRRRSVEVNRFKPQSGKRPFLDPVAVLGSESPRLPLPVARYSVATVEGQEVERYAFVADVERYEDMGGGGMTAVSGSNSYLPSASLKKTRYEDQNAMDVNPQQNGADDSMVSQIVDAILSTPQMQWVTAKMQAEGQGQQPGAQPGAPQPPTPPSQPVPPQPQSAPGAPPVQDKDKDGYGMGMGAPTMPTRYDNSDDPNAVEKEQYSQLKSEFIELKERYSELADVNAQNMEQLAKMSQAFVQLEQRAVDADRTVALKDLYSRYPQFAQVESIDEQLEKCLYAHGADMNSEAFEKHIATVEKYAKAYSPTTAMLPGGEALPSKERFSAEHAELAKEIYQSNMDAGKILTWDECCRLATERAAK